MSDKGNSSSAGSDHEHLEDLPATNRGSTVATTRMEQARKTVSDDLSNLIEARKNERKSIAASKFTNFQGAHRSTVHGAVDLSRRDTTAISNMEDLQSMLRREVARGSGGTTDMPRRRTLADKPRARGKSLLGDNAPTMSNLGDPDLENERMDAMTEMSCLTPVYDLLNRGGRRSTRMSVTEVATQIINAGRNDLIKTGANEDAARVDNETMARLHKLEYARDVRTMITKNGRAPHVKIYAKLTAYDEIYNGKKPRSAAANIKLKNKAVQGLAKQRLDSIRDRLATVDPCTPRFGARLSILSLGSDEGGRSTPRGSTGSFQAPRLSTGSFGMQSTLSEGSGPARPGGPPSPGGRPRPTLTRSFTTDSDGFDSPKSPSSVSTLESPRGAASSSPKASSKKQVLERGTLAMVSSLHLEDVYADDSGEQQTPESNKITMTFDSAAADPKSKHSPKRGGAGCFRDNTFEGAVITRKRLLDRKAEDLGLTEKEYDAANYHLVTIDDLETAAANKAFKQRKAAVRLIEDSWIYLTLRRLARQARQHRHDCARQIQCWFRCHVRFMHPLQRRLKLRRTQRAAVIKLQARTRGWLRRREMRLGNEMRDLIHELTAMQLELKVIPVSQLIRLQAIARGGAARRVFRRKKADRDAARAAAAAAAAAEKAAALAAQEELECEIQEADMFEAGAKTGRRLSATLALPGGLLRSSQPGVQDDDSSCPSTRAPSTARAATRTSDRSSSKPSDSPNYFTPTPPPGTRQSRGPGRPQSSCDTERQSASPQGPNTPQRPQSSCLEHGSMRGRRFKYNGQRYNPSWPLANLCQRMESPTWCPLLANRTPTPDLPNFMRAL